MNFNTSPIAFFPSRAAQIWRAWFAQRKISVICGADLLPFYIIDNGSAPAGGELYDPNTDTKVDDIDFAGHLLDHDITVDGQSRHVWIYQGEMAGVFGRTNPGYYYLKIGNWYSDVFRIGALSSEYTEISWQFFDDIITADGTPISKHIKYKQIFETPLWHPTYNVEEEGKTNNGIFFAMSQTTKKTSGFNAIVNESQLDCLNLTRMADMINIKACLNGTTRTMQTNQFEISSKWESDDVASIECQFDLFAIIRKYQQSNVEPEPLPIPTPPEPPTVYKIRGTAKSGASSVTLLIGNTPTPVAVTNGRWVYGYDTPLNSSFECSDNNISTIDFTESCQLKQVTVFYINSESVTDIDFGMTTLESLTHTYRMFYGAKSLKSVNIPYANINTQGVGTASECSMFDGCESLKTINIPNSDLSKQLGNTYKSFFSGCKSLETVSIPDTDFDNSGDFENFFQNAKVDGTFTFGNVTLSNCTNAKQMFNGSIGNIDLNAIFPNVSGFVPSYVDRICLDAKGANIDLSGLDFSNITSMRQAFYRAVNMQNLTLDTATLNGVTDWSQAFGWCYNYTGAATTFATFTFAAATNVSAMFVQGLKGAFSLPAATFANVTNANLMFQSCKCSSISLPAATFASVDGQDSANLFWESTELESVSMPAATFASMTNNILWGMDCNKWTTFAGSGAELFTLGFIIYAKNITAASVLEMIGLLGNATSRFFGIYSSTWNGFSAADQSAINSALTAKGYQLWLQ